MLELIAELGAASTLLNTPIDQYLDACTAIQTYYTQTAVLSGVPSILSSRVADESVCTQSYTARLNRACSVINQARNISTTLAPIHRLPSEVLARIFLLVVGTSCGIDVNDGKSRSIPKYPDFLSHVCSHWRQTCIELPALWTHIDLAYFHSSGERFLDRAEIFAARSKSLPLDIHIRIPKSWDSVDDKAHALRRFLNSVSERTKALDLATPTTVESFQASFFASFCNSMRPGVLLEFSVTDRGPYVPNLLYGADSEEETEDLESEPEMDELRAFMRQQQLEDLLLPVRVLRLSGLYPHWASQAYRGLVELRLDRPAGSWGYGISALQLYKVLTSSPKLAVLHFGLDIIDEIDDSSSAPVHLQELRILNLHSLHNRADLERFLSMLAPCLGPIDLTIWLEGTGVALLSCPDSSITKFLRESNVERLHLGGHDCDQVLATADLPNILPSLRVLLLHQVNNYTLHPPFGELMNNSYPIAPFTLETIYLQAGTFDLGYLCHLIKRCSAQAIVLRGSTVCCNTKPLRRNEITERLSQFSPIVKHLYGDSCLIQDTLFKLHRDILKRHSGFFADMLSLPITGTEGQDDEHPLCISQDLCSLNAFKTICSFLYPKEIGTFPSVLVSGLNRWEPVLMASEALQFHSIRKYLLSELQKDTASIASEPVRLLYWAMQSEPTVQTLALHCFQALAYRRQPLSELEILKLGSKTTMQVMHVREKLRTTFVSRESLVSKLKIRPCERPETCPDLIAKWFTHELSKSDSASRSNASDIFQISSGVPSSLCSLCRANAIYHIRGLRSQVLDNKVHQWVRDVGALATASQSAAARAP